MIMFIKKIRVINKSSDFNLKYFWSCKMMVTENWLSALLTALICRIDCTCLIISFLSFCLWFNIWTLHGTNVVPRLGLFKTSRGYTSVLCRLMCCIVRWNFCQVFTKKYRNEFFSICFICFLNVPIRCVFRDSNNLANSTLVS